MQKTFKISNLDCAHCATEIENAICKIKGVSSANLSLFTQKLVVEYNDNSDDILLQIQKIAHKIEPECEISE